MPRITQDQACIRREHDFRAIYTSSSVTFLYKPRLGPKPLLISLVIMKAIILSARLARASM